MSDLLCLFHSDIAHKTKLTRPSPTYCTGKLTRLNLPGCLCTGKLTDFEVPISEDSDDRLSTVQVTCAVQDVFPPHHHPPPLPPPASPPSPTCPPDRAVQRLHQYSRGPEHNQHPPPVCQDSPPIVRGGRMRGEGVIE